MTSEQALQLVKGYLTKQFEVPEEKILPEAHLFKDLNLDSIDALDMIGLMETDLHIPVREDELRALRTVEDVVQYLVRHAPADG